MQRLRAASVISIGSYAFILTFAVAVPVLTFMVFLLLELERDNEAALERRTGRDAKAIAVTVERQLQDLATTLRLLATAPELMSGDLRTFHERARLALADSRYFVLLLQEDGRQLLNTRVEFGTPLGKTSNLDSLKSVLKSGRLEVSDVFYGHVSKKWVFNVLIPLPFDVQATPAALLITKDADDLQMLIAADGMVAGWSSAIIDAAGNVLAEVGAAQLEAGNPLALADELKGRHGIGVLHHNQDLIGYAELQGWPWRVVVWGPIDAAQPSILVNRGVLLLGGLLLLLLVVTAAAYIGRLLRQPIEQIAELAKQVGRGEIVPPIATRIRELNEVSIALTNASFDRNQSEQRIRVIKNELTHRTKNMLTVVLAMIRQTARTHDVQQPYLEAITARLQALGTSIDLLAQEQLKGVSLRELLTVQLGKFSAEQSQWNVNGVDFRLSPEAVHSLGMAFHELGTNSLKYGALSVPQGSIEVSWEILDELTSPNFRITWNEADGPPVKEPEQKGFGTVIITQHVSAALKATASATYEKSGFRWTVTGPMSSFGTANLAQVG